MSCGEMTRRNARYGALHRDDKHRSLVKASVWATFVGLPNLEALFTGLYRACYVGLNTSDYVSPTRGEIDAAGTLHQYHLDPLGYLSHFQGRIVIKWADTPQSARTYVKVG